MNIFEVIKKENVWKSYEIFIDGVNKLITRKDEWQSIGNRMKEIYRNQYCWDEMERRLIQLYTDL